MIEVVLVWVTVAALCVGAGYGIEWLTQRSDPHSLMIERLNNAKAALAAVEATQVVPQLPYDSSAFWLYPDWGEDLKSPFWMRAPLKPAGQPSPYVSGRFNTTMTYRVPSPLRVTPEILVNEPDCFIVPATGEVVALTKGWQYHLNTEVDSAAFHRLPLSYQAAIKDFWRRRGR